MLSSLAWSYWLLFYLSPKTIELKSIILSGNDLNVDEIIKEIQKDIKDKYELGITKKNMFLRETGSQKFKKLEIKIVVLQAY